MNNSALSEKTGNMGFISRWPSKAKHFLRDYSAIGNRDFYLLINDGGIFVFRVLGRKFQMFVEHNRDFRRNLGEDVNFVIEKLRKSDGYIGQDLIVLMGGSYCFHSIQENKDLLKIDIKKSHPGLDEKTTIMGAAIIEAGKDRKLAYLGGIGRITVETISETLRRYNIRVKWLGPVVLYLLELAPKCRFKYNSIIHLPGETICINNNGIIQAVELPQHIESGRSKEIFGVGAANDNNPNRTIAVYSFGLETQAQSGNKVVRCQDKPHNLLPYLSPQYPFWAAKTAGKHDHYAGVIVSAFRLASLILGIMAVGFIAASFSLSLFATRYDSLVKENRQDLERKLTLQADLQKSEMALEKLGVMKNPQISFAGAISTFCQRRPFGLNMTEINIKKSDNDYWILTADGLADSETAVFAYCKYIAEQSNKANPEVISVKRLSSRLGNIQPGTNSGFVFKIKMELDK